MSAYISYMFTLTPYGYLRITYGAIVHLVPNNVPTFT